MLDEPTCYVRQCIFFQGVKRLGQAESTEVVYCKAFPDGIPAQIAYGNNKHLTLLASQENNIVYQEKT